VHLPSCFEAGWNCRCIFYVRYSSFYYYAKLTRGEKAAAMHGKTSPNVHTLGCYKLYNYEVLANLVLVALCDQISVTYAR